jgi:hypothetical protein
VSRSLRIAVWGTAALVLYLAAVAVTYRSELVVGRPLYNGEVPPPPYNWVDPPADLVDENTPPQPGASRVEFTEEGSRGRTVATGDGQAFLILGVGGIEPMEGEEAVEVTLTPRVADPPSTDGMRIDGNAYDIEAVYETSREPAVLLRRATVVLRFPVHATEVVRLEGGVWESAGPTQISPQSAQVFVRVNELGTFAAAGEPPPREIPTWVFAAAASAVVIAVLAILERRRSSRRREPGTGRVRPGAGHGRRPKRRR